MLRSLNLGAFTSCSFYSIPRRRRSCPRRYIALYTARRSGEFHLTAEYLGTCNYFSTLDAGWLAASHPVMWTGVETYIRARESGSFRG